MNFYDVKDYKERYYILFDDVDGNQWKVSIEDPLFVGEPTSLTGGEFPVTWEGEGDESQEEVVLGSTGKISLVCLDGQQQLFTVGNILPSEINDRRVRVLRYMYNDWYPYWQGFIKPETFSQDWDSTPYEIELPIVSAVAAMEYFYMPLPDYDGPSYNAYNDLFFGVTNIADLIRAIIVAMGCEFRRITSNRFELLDMEGNTVMIPDPSSESGETYPMHWTQGDVSSLWFYDIEDGVMQPKTFKDVMETICYPYGKLHEYGTDLAIIMHTKDDATSDAYMYYLYVWSDYEHGVINWNDVRFYTIGRTYQIGINDVMPADTDNTISLLPPPSSVSFTNNLDKQKEIFELTEKFIKPDLPIPTSLDDPRIKKNEFDGLTRYFILVNKDYVNMGFADEWEFGNIQAGNEFVRVIEVSGSSSWNVNYNKTVPLGFLLPVIPSSGLTPSVNFALANGIITRPGRNRLKLSVKCYSVLEKDPIHGSEGSTAIHAIIQDLHNGKYLQTGQVWADTPFEASLVDWQYENNECTRVILEERAVDDNTPHRLKFTFKGMGHTTYIMFKLEYEKDTTFYEDVLLGEFGNNIRNNGGNIANGSGGEEINIDFKTLACKVQTIDGSLMMPFNSFCNSKYMIDTDTRKMIEIDSAQFKRYYEGHSLYWDLATSYAVITDGNDVYVPVAVGMNPRMNTLQLKLVSTNVTS